MLNEFGLYPGLFACCFLRLWVLLKSPWECRFLLFLCLGRQSAHLAVCHRWVVFPVSVLFSSPSLCCFGSTACIPHPGCHFRHSLDQSWLLKASLGFLCLCVTERSFGRHWGLCWFIHSVGGPASPDLPSLDFPRYSLTHRDMFSYSFWGNKRLLLSLVPCAVV